MIYFIVDKIFEKMIVFFRWINPKGLSYQLNDWIFVLIWSYLQ